MSSLFAAIEVASLLLLLFFLNDLNVLPYELAAAAAVIIILMSFRAVAEADDVALFVTELIRFGINKAKQDIIFAKSHFEFVNYM